MNFSEKQKRTVAAIAELRANEKFKRKVEGQKSKKNGVFWERKKLRKEGYEGG